MKRMPFYFVENGENTSMERLLQEFIIKSQEIIKDNLTGIYLHGSAVMGCFNPEKSDLDLIVVVNEPQTPSLWLIYFITTNV